MRTILSHVNVELPDDSRYSSADVENELALLLGITPDDPDNFPALAAAKVAIALTEEV